MCVCVIHYYYTVYVVICTCKSRPRNITHVCGLEDDVTLIISESLFAVCFNKLLIYSATPATMKKIDKRRLDELDSSTLVELIKDYMKENQELRRENMDLFSVRDMMLRDQELVCRENERLLKKLEDVNS